MDDFLVARQEFADSLGKPDLYQYIDHFGLYAGQQTISSKLFIYDLLKECLEVPGHVLEFGCWKGSNLLFLAKVLYSFQPNSPKRLFGFDNFSGLPAPTDSDGEVAALSQGMYKGDERVLRSALELFGLQEKVNLVVGDATQTIPRFRYDHPEIMVSFAFFDFDLYEPTKAALELIDDALVPGGIVVFDQAGTQDWPGETLALAEHLRATNSRYRALSNPLSPQPTMAFQKLP